MQTLRLAGVLASVPVVAVVAAVLLDVPVAGAIVLTALLALVWALFVLQLWSGRSARALFAYGRLRRDALRLGHPDDGGARRTIERPRPSFGPQGLPRLAWSHDGWAHADGHLAALDRLSQWFDVTAFGCESRWRGDPPVTLELLPAVGYGAGIKLRGLEDALQGFDVVWTGGSFEGTTFQALDARARGGPAVVSLEVENLIGNYGGPGHPVRTRSVREVDHFCATSTAAAALLMLDGVEQERISLVPMVVDMPRLGDGEAADMRRRARERLGIAGTAVVGLYLGRLIADKGVSSLIGALGWARRFTDGRALELVIAGGGDAADELRGLANGYELDGAVHFTGAVGPDERRELLAAADFLVLPSMAPPHWLEQFGRVIPEAFGFGLPVIGAASGAIPEVIGDAGRVVAPGDFGALAGALLDLAGAGRRGELSARARRRAELYSVDAFAERMHDALMAGIHHRQRAR